MIAMNYIRRSEPVKTDHLEVAREAFGENFDRYMLNFYTTGNGGVPDNQIIKTDRGEEFWLQYVFPIPDRDGITKNNLIKNNKLVRGDNLVPSGYIVFGEDPGANFFSLNCHDGSVCYHAMDVWDADIPIEQNHERSMCFLSGSVDSFISSLEARQQD